MDAQPEAETKSCFPSTVVASEDSEEESSQEEPPAASWSELSIIERVGLNSMEMSEEDLETAFSQIALAFRCDQYTLKQRLQAEEHARNLAEENVHLEMTRGRETLEMLKGLCLDSKRSRILQRLELSLDILGGTVERISNTAEVLGAVHQEARVSRAVELMVSHVENLRRRHDRNVADLEEAKRLIQQQSGRNMVDPRASPDLDDSDSRMRMYQQNNTRRRVSISVISSTAQEKIKQEVMRRASRACSSGKPSVRSASQSSESSCSAAAKDDSCSVEDRPVEPEETPSEASNGPLPPAIPDPECLPAKQVAPRKKTQNKISPPHSLRQRHKGKSALSKKKGDKDKKTRDIYQQLSVDKYGSVWTQHPVPQWLYSCRWVLLCMYLLVLFSVITLTFFLLEAS